MECTVPDIVIECHQNVDGHKSNSEDSIKVNLYINVFCNVSLITLEYVHYAWLMLTLKVFWAYLQA